MVPDPEGSYIHKRGGGYDVRQTKYHSKGTHGRRDSRKKMFGGPFYSGVNSLWEATKYLHRQFLSVISQQDVKMIRDETMLCEIEQYPPTWLAGTRLAEGSETRGLWLCKFIQYHTILRESHNLPPPPGKKRKLNEWSHLWSKEKL